MRSIFLEHVGIGVWFGCETLMNRVCLRTYIMRMSMNAVRCIAKASGSSLSKEQGFHSIKGVATGHMGL